MKVILSTCSKEQAGAVADAIVQERLAACCNQVPGIRSTYWWQGALTTDEEVLLIFKTRDEQVSALMQRLQTLHPYQTPEIIVLPVETGLPAYLDWVTRETTTDGA